MNESLVRHNSKFNFSPFFCRIKDQDECFDDAKGLHESYASQRFTKYKAIRDIQDG